MLQPLRDSSPSSSSQGGGVVGGWRMSALLVRTPEAMMAAHAQAGRWGEVFQVAQAYGMDQDEVYRLRWASEEVTARSIQENLRPMVRPEVKELVGCW